MKIINFIFSVIVGILILLGSLILGILNFWILFLPWYKRYKIADKTFITPYSNFVNNCFLFIRLKIIGRENVVKNRPTLYICNHQSWMDIQIFVKHSHATAIAKNEVLSIPFVGFLCLLAGSLFFDSKNNNAKIVIVKKAMQVFKHKCSLCLFPEGTRSKNGNLLKPNLSIIKLCYKQNIPVVPAALEGTRNVMTRGSVLFKFFQKVILKYNPPLLPENFPDEETFARACWQKVIDTHDEISKSLISITGKNK
jgi:1-acyl-sn-glycerol-3-phosphate acyltransferase